MLNKKARVNVTDAGLASLLAFGLGVARLRVTLSISALGTATYFYVVLSREHMKIRNLQSS